MKDKKYNNQFLLRRPNPLKMRIY